MAKQLRSLQERVHIIEEIEKNPFEKRVEAARRLSVPISTLNSIISKKNENGSNCCELYKFFSTFDKWQTVLHMRISFITCF